jgi:AraC-like DNA-binding protein
MKPSFVKLPNQDYAMLEIRRDKHLYKYWHYHEEYELVYIVKGEGLRFVGDNVSKFAEGDLVLLGSLLPHLWLHQEDYVGDSSPAVDAIILHINKKMLNGQILNFAEFEPLKTLFAKATCGIRFIEPSKSILDKVQLLLDSSGIERVVHFLDLFKDLAGEESYETLSSPSFSSMHRKHASDRLSKVYDFIANNFTRKITLEEIADLAHMTTNGFCNYFKKNTGRTVFQYINELKIGYAKKLMIESDMSISEAAFQSGFNSISFFNRVFRKSTGKSPREYKDGFKVIKGKN